MDQKIVVIERFEGNDPAAPLGCIVSVVRDGREVCFFNFPNEDNEDIQNIVLSVLVEKLHTPPSWRTEADPDFGYW